MSDPREDTNWSRYPIQEKIVLLLGAILDKLDGLHGNIRAVEDAIKTARSSFKS